MITNSDKSIFLFISSMKFHLFIHSNIYNLKLSSYNNQNLQSINSFSFMVKQLYRSKTQKNKFKSQLINKKLDSKFKYSLPVQRILDPLSMSEQQKPVQTKLEHGYFRLTHELLKHVKINEITFAFFRLIQTLQIIHIAFRHQTCGAWDTTIFKYTELIINYISVDYLIQQNPGIFLSISIGVFSLMFLTVLAMILLGWKLKTEKRPHSIMKSLFPLVNFSLYLFKTIFQIPILTLIYISIMTSYKQAIKVDTGSIGVLIGVLNLILFIMIQVYLVTSFQDCNPFSDLIHAGESYTKGVMMLVYKIVFSLYLALDHKGQLGRVFLIVFTIVNLAWAAYSHLQIGFYKLKIRTICIKLHYAILAFTFISLMKTFRPQDEISILFFLCSFYIMCYIFCDYVEKNLCLAALEKQMMFIKDVSDLENHIIHLIRNIDTFEKRESRVLLQGYLAYHHRQCKLPATNCICHHLKQVKQRTTQQKSEFFAFVIDILKENLNRFNDAKKIHLLLSFIFQYRQKNRFQAIYSLNRTLKQDTFMNRLYFYHQINLIEGEMIQDDSKDLTNKAVDINKFFDYNNLIVSFEEMLEECSRAHISFWKELLQVNTDIKKLERSGTMVTKSKDTVRDEFEKMINMNPNNVHTLTVYGRFLIDVANQQASNIKYLEKAQSILKNLKQSSKIDDNSNKYTDNAQTTVVVIDGCEGRLGEIVHTNNYVKKMLGYKRSECIGTNVNAIMPKIFGEHHNAVLQKYLSTSSDKYNGKQRIVPALGKDGYMIAVVALTKALPNLQNGIQIVGFISKLEQRAEQQEIVRKYFYLLYRCDNQQVVGISHNCYTDFHIPCCLIYGNPYNNNNELKIRNLFGFSFEKDKEGQVSTALETSEVVLTLNTTKLSEEFIITRSGTNEQIKDDLGHLDSSDFGIQVKIVAKCLLSYNYNGIPLKMLSIYKYGEDCFESKNDEVNNSNSKIDESSRYFQKAQNDDFKDLKDFKNFISIKSEPSAISIINNICCVLMFVIASCIITFIAIWLSLKSQNGKVLDGTRKSLHNEIITPNLLFEMEKHYINRNPFLTNNKFNQTVSQQSIKQMIAYIKTNEREFLPIKFSFMNNYNKAINYYTFDTLGAMSMKRTFIDEAVTMYISLFEALIDSQLDSLYTNPTRYDSNPFLMYLAVKSNELFSIRQGNLQTLEDVINAYYNQVSLYKIIFYILSAVMLFGVILWFFTSIPYVLSVTKINNRVLSLFSLIPNHDVLRLIGRCHLYMKENLTEAVVNEEDVDQILDDGPNGDNQNQSYMGASSLGISSPAPFLGSKNNASDLSPLPMKKSSSIFNQSGSPLTVEEKFSKMVNSENQQKNKTILQFLLVSLLLIGYFLFNHFYAFNNVNSIQTSVENLKNLGRRISILTNVKLLLTEYVMNQNYQLNSTLPSIRDLNNKIIDQSYAIERTLLKMNIGTMASTLEKYNSGNLCNFIDEYKDSSIFPTQYTQTECIGLKQGILGKGIKTAIVTMLEEVRTILSMQSIPNRPQLLQQKMIEYESLIKYLENPMLKIISGTEKQVNDTNSLYQLVLIICSTIFLAIVVGFWRIVWTIYIEELNNKIWRTKGMLNIIPMRIITANELLKNEFASGQLEKAVR